MTLVDTGTDPWVLQLDACENVAREIMEDLILRDNESVLSQKYDSLSAKIRIRLKQFSTEVNELKQKLSSNEVSTITLEEKERRRRQVESLLSKQVQLTDCFNKKERKSNFKTKSAKDTRKELFEQRNKNALADAGTTSWGEIGLERGDNSDDRTVDEMREEQQRLLEEQDKGLENLLKIVTAQTKIATSINNEVEHHNDLLVDIASGMERVDGRLSRTTNLVKEVQKKESVWGYWLVAFLLFIAIIGVTFA